ncbi:MAG: c-type cytochrome, partial [Pirellulaceae bacterium]|nr:c-type cytochrome [Pirellulaceae bacterium]
GELQKESTTLEQVRQLAVLDDPQIDKLVIKLWGKLESTTPEVKLAEVRRLNNDLRAAAGDAQAGQAVFKKHCIVCHRLHNEGGVVGPDLTSANRADRDFLLVSLVDPSSVIRKEYLSVIVRTVDDRILTGIAKAQTGGQLNLLTAKNETLTVAADEIAEVRDSPVSLMPDDLIRQLTPQELRDLFAYLAQ